jgi:hypothetical protein
VTTASGGRVHEAPARERRASRVNPTTRPVTKKTVGPDGSRGSPGVASPARLERRRGARRDRRSGRDRWTPAVGVPAAGRQAALADADARGKLREACRLGKHDDRRGDKRPDAGVSQTRTSPDSHGLPPTR